jgi:hypothetical protein
VTRLRWMTRIADIRFTLVSAAEPRTSSILAFDYMLLDVSTFFLLRRMQELLMSQFLMMMMMMALQ